MNFLICPVFSTLKSLSVIFLFAFFPSLICAQTIEWVIDPIISDADKIMLNEYKQDDINLIAFRKDGKWGMKNAKNELLAPPEFDGAQVWLTGKYFDMREGRVQRYFDTEGYEIDFSEVDAYQKKVQARKKIKELEDDIIELEGNHDWIDFNTDGKRILALNKESGDTISSVVFKGKINMSDEGFSIWPEFKTGDLLVKDKNGKVVRTLDKKASVAESRSNRFIIRVGSKEGFLDAKGNEIFKTEYENIRFVSDDYIGISKDGEVMQLADLDGKIIPGMSGTGIYKSKIENKIIIEKSKYETIFFDEISKKGITYPFDLVGRVINKSIYQVRNSDTLGGLYNIVTNEEIVPCKYRRVIREGSFLMVGNYKVKKSKRRKRTLQYRSIIDIKGNVILQDSMSSVKLIDNKLFAVLGSNKITKIYKTDGTFIEELEEKSRVSISKNSKYFTITNRDYGYITVEQYLAGESKNSFDSVGKLMSNKSKTNKYSLVKKENKFGLIDQQGNIIIPIELDEIILESSYKKCAVVKQNKKWGAIRNPLYDI